jgi:cytochrome c553
LSFAIANFIFEAYKQGKFKNQSNGGLSVKSLTLILCATLLNFSAAYADGIGDVANSKCVKCHSPGANFPSLGAQTSEYLFQTMKDYQTGARHSDGSGLMAKRVKSLDEDTLRGLAEYFSKTDAPTPVSGDAALVAKGKDIYENGIQAKSVRSCSDCHGRNGEGRGGGNGLNPRLAGQQQDFLVSQMVAYKAGAIDNQKDMSAIAAQLSDSEMKAVAAYLQSK